MIKIFTDNLEYSKQEIAKIFNLNIDDVEGRYFKQSNKLRVA